MDLKLNQNNQIEATMRCRPVFLKGKNNGKESMGVVKELVNKFFENGVVKKFNDYMIPSLDQWVDDNDRAFLIKDSGDKQPESEVNKDNIDQNVKAD